MEFKIVPIEARIIKRYRRFLADIRAPDGTEFTVHVPNTGSMKSCWAPNWPVVISDSENPKRKYRYTLEMLHNGDTWIGVNTTRPNALVESGIKMGEIPELQGYSILRREVKYGQNSRIDILLEDAHHRCYVEVKNSTLRTESSTDVHFPDAVSERGQKHIDELVAMIREGHRAVMFYLVQREDVKRFRPAWDIDPIYAEKLENAVQQGLEVLVYQCRLQPGEIHIHKKLPVDLTDFRWQ